jgi:nucleosome assembly protein 1-like 1
MVKRTVPCDTFFNFFSPQSISDDEEIDEEQLEEAGEKIEADYEVK